MSFRGPYVSRRRPWETASKKAREGGENLTLEDSPKVGGAGRRVKKIQRVGKKKARKAIEEAARRVLRMSGKGLPESKIRCQTGRP